MGVAEMAEQSRRTIDHYTSEIAEEWKLHLGLWASLLFLTLPVILVAVMSTQTNNQILDFTYLLPGSEGLSNYIEVMGQEGFGRFLLNSFVMAMLVSIGKIMISMLAALAIVFYDFPFKRGLFLLILLTLMLPVPVRIVPLFELMVDFGWQDSMYALVLPYLASPTAVLLLRQHFRSISDSMVETAKLDGVGPIRFLVYVLIPMSKSMIIGLFVISFIWAWNQYLWPLVAIQSEQKQVVQVALKQLQGAQAGGEPLWGLIMAGTILALLPPLIILIIMHKPLLETFNVQTK